MRLEIFVKNIQDVKLLKYLNCFQKLIDQERNALSSAIKFLVSPIYKIDTEFKINDTLAKDSPSRKI